MSFNFSFNSIGDEKDVARVIDSIRQQSLDYPNYEDWVQKTRAELLAGWKRGIQAFSDGVLVGSLIYQPHKELKGVLEAKNARVHPKIEGRFGMAFMFRQMEVEARGKYGGIICDTHADNHRVRRFLEFMGYREIFRGKIYNSNREEIVYLKNLTLNL